MDDSDVLPDAKVLEDLADWVNEKRALGPTLVHCQAGLNRSALVAGLALIRSGMAPRDAIALLRQKRSSDVLFNKAFERWLLGRPMLRDT
jgi:protein-tyrosine phosphatase